MRRGIAAVVVVVVAVAPALAGCSSDDDAGSSRRSAERSSTSTSSTVVREDGPDGESISRSGETPTTGPPVTEAPVDPETAALFDAQLGGVQAALGGAGGDACAVARLMSQMPLPATAEQAERTVGVFELLFAAAAGLKQTDAADAAAFRSTATALRAEGEATGYDADFRANAQALADPGFATALAHFHAATAACEGVR